jgi:hypothetical protein
MSFRLPSLHLSTEFDRPVLPLQVPGVASRGDTPSLFILDGASRGPRRLARVARRAALVGLQLEPPTTPVRVHVTLLVDDLSTALWRSAHLVDIAVMPDEHHRHRLVRVGLQGRTRAGVLLDRQPGDVEPSRQRLSFDLTPEELGDVGLLVLSLDVPTDPPAWLARDLLEDGLAGVCIGRVGVEPLGNRPARPSVSTGREPVRGRSLVLRSPGGLVLNPGADGDVRLELTPRVLVPRPAPVGRRAMVKEPAAKARDLVLRTLHTVVREPLHAEITPLDGGPTRTLTARPDATGSYAFDVASELLPAWVRPTAHRLPSTHDWYARAR